MYLENFVSEREWQNFINNYKRLNDLKTAADNKEFADTAVADEDIWVFITAAFFNFISLPLLVITSTVDRAQMLSGELKCIERNVKIFDYPSLGNNIFYRDKNINNTTLSKRLEVIKNLLKYKENRKPFIIISTVNALLNLICEANIKLLENITLRAGDDYSREKLIQAVSEKGYERVYKVYDRGEFSIRGEIFDIFDITSNNPVRVVFLGDMIEKIISYNAQSQEKIESFDKISIFPSLNPWKIDKNLIGSTKSGEYKGRFFSFIDLIKKNTKEFGILVCDPLEVYLKIKSDIDILLKSFDKDKNLAIKNKDVLKSFIIDKNFLEKTEIKPRLNLFSTLSRIDNGDKFLFSSTKGQKRNLGNSQVFVQNIKKDIKNRKRIIISLKDNERIKKIEQIFLDSNISYSYLEKKDKSDFKKLKTNIVYISGRKLNKGFESDIISLYGELDIYNFPSSKKTEGKIISSGIIEQLNHGDYVVHKTHGIGKYIDVITAKSNGHKKEYFLIEYANNDKLYIPTWQADRIHKYIGEKNPRITPLDSKYWDGVKNRVRKSVRKLAVDLNKLYAERKASEGFSFSHDSPWLNEIEDIFPFKETDDQKKAIEHVKREMEKPKPMDIILCGDVGFGKTEVAIRAAFKAMENGKQVLMLVPTTILADQHYRTFSERYKNYPVIIDVLSRFRTRKEQIKIVESFNSGKIDMLIGTHRILQNDINPKDLGLLIIDEEQRFGVNSKEKIKSLKKEVDVLTLSATPIPRTLYMTLTGIRDIVLIETFPEGRQPIETFVGEKDDFVIKMAIERELERGGQVYYVCSRIYGIEKKLKSLQTLVRNARISMAHGQMDSKKIEKVMDDFVNRKYDILLTTTIIESGMDIGNVNTLIVEDSHRFGLSQLYQLRGRVGRSAERAYAYFFYPGRKVLNLNSLQRLKTLAEYTELGSGYNIAMRDLEIRGAGELLGPRQHGHINSVGFDMYCQIIREEIEKLKGNKVDEDINIQIDLPVSAYIPESYIKSYKDRIDIYKVLGNVNYSEQISNISERIIERYGKMPSVVENLLNIAKIKYLLKKARIEKLIFTPAKGIILKKVSMRIENTFEMNKKNKNIIYKPKEKEVVIKNSEGEIDLSLVLSNLDDIISFT